MEPIFSPIVLLVVAGVLIVLTPSYWARASRARVALTRFARHAGLPITADLRCQLERILRLRAVPGALGTAAALVLLSAGAALTDPQLDSLGWHLVVIGTACTGTALGVGLTAARQAIRAHPSGGTRLARLAAPTFAHYVRPAELRGARLAAVAPAGILSAAVAVGLAAPVLAARDVLSAAAVVAVLLPLLALTGSEAAGRRLVNQLRTLPRRWSWRGAMPSAPGCSATS